MECHYDEVSDYFIYKKSVELENWKLHHVYERVENKGQMQISVRWVVTQKYKDSNITYKARLVAWGYG